MFLPNSNGSAFNANSGDRHETFPVDSQRKTPGGMEQRNQQVQEQRKVHCLFSGGMGAETSRKQYCESS
ncbi:MAG: hypothetical protein B1H09_03375 [Gemmatimonadaceae bacterium 4484_173]|nr:MAG: hypothetical protein B1H09_03375 [Gemmatimonadaceae bacterium 4484_173]RKZ04434.1 MAG: hypothetical protein DRQ21_02585 [Candidatus Fermentibacteria bacterium]